MALGSLVVEIVGDASALQKELKEAVTSSETFAAKARASLNAVGGALAAVGSAAAVAFGAMVGAGMNSAREIKNLSSVANAGAEQFQEMAYAAKSVGIEQDKLADILKDVNDRIGDFITTGGGPMADFFERIAPKVGVTVDQFRKLSGPDALQLYVSSLEKANLSQQEMTFFLEAMASDSTKLIPLLKDNAAGLRTMSDEARQLGIVTSSIDLNKIQAAQQAMGSASNVADAFNRAMASEAAPVVAAVADSFKDWAKEMGGFDKVARNTIDGLVTGAGFVSDVFRGWQIILQGNIALIQTIAAAATNGAKDFAESTREWRLSIFDALDKLAEKSPYKIDLGLKEAAKESEARFFQIANAVDKNAQESIKSLQELIAAPLPSDELGRRVDEWRNKATAAAVEIDKARNAGNGGKQTNTVETVQRFTVQESDTETEKIRERLKQRSATFESWRASQITAEQAYAADVSAVYARTYADRLEATRKALEAEAATLADARARGLITEQEYATRSASIDAQTVEARKKAAAEIAAIKPTPYAIGTLESSDPALRAEVERITGTQAAIRSATAENNANLLEQFAQYQADRERNLIDAQAREDAILKDRYTRGLLSQKEYEQLSRQLDADHNAQLIEARAAAAQELERLSSVRPLGIDPLSEQGADTVRQLRERLDSEAETMAEYNAMKLEQLQAQQDAEVAILQARYDAELLSRDQFEQLKTGIEQEGARKRQEIADAERSAKLGIFASMFDNIASLMQTGSRKMFEIGKAASVASGLASAYESVMSAYAAGAKVGGPILGAAYATAAGLAQAVNLRKLSSVSFGSGGSVSTSGSSGSVPSASGSSGGGSGTTSAAPAMPSRNISISLAGSFFSADNVRELINQINEQIGDGSTIRTT